MRKVLFVVMCGLFLVACQKKTVETVTDENAKQAEEPVNDEAFYAKLAKSVCKCIKSSHSEAPNRGPALVTPSGGDNRPNSYSEEKVSDCFKASLGSDIMDFPAEQQQMFEQMMFKYCPEYKAWKGNTRPRPRD